jgi:hypothetical protein
MFGFVFYKNAWKIIWNFLLFSLLQINIFDIFIYFYIFFKYIEIILSCIIKNIRIFILILKILLFVL